MAVKTIEEACEVIEKFSVTNNLNFKKEKSKTGALYTKEILLPLGVYERRQEVGRLQHFMDTVRLALRSQLASYGGIVLTAPLLNLSIDSDKSVIKLDVRMRTPIPFNPRQAR